MRQPDAIWPMTYAADRRKHRHRCICGCNTIVQPGMEVFMAKVDNRKTRVLRADHADRLHSTPEAGWTAREALELHGVAHLAACGWPEAKATVATNPFFRGGGVKP